MLNELQSKLLILIIFIFNIIISATVLFEPSAAGYELSIYNAYPSYLFILIILTQILNIFLAMDSIYHHESKKYLFLSILSFVLLEFILILIPFARGYAFFGRHDPMTHIGMIKDVLITGHIHNFYPIFHILASSFLVILGINPTDKNLFLLRLLIPFLFSVISITFIGLLSKAMSSSTTKSGSYASCIAILFAIISMTTFNLDFTPAYTLFMLFPMFLYLYYLGRVGNNWKYLILLILIVMLLPFGHPELVTFALIAMIIYEFLIYFNGKLSLNQIKDMPKKSSSNIIIILIASFFTWYSSFAVFSNQLLRIWKWFFEQLGSSSASDITSKLGRASISRWDILFLFSKMYGIYIIYLTFALIIFLKSFRKLLQKKNFNINYIYLGLLILATSLFSVFSLFNEVVLSYERILKYPLLFSTILIGIYLTDKYNIIKYKKRYFFIIFSLLSIAMCINVLTFYPSPITLTYNQQVTNAEVSGSNWLISYGNEKIESIDTFVVFGRFVHFRQGYEYSQTNNWLYSIQLYQSKRTPPADFNYKNSSELGTSYSKDKYLLTSDLVKAFYWNLFPKSNKYTKTDFSELNEDNSINKIYDNNGFDIYYITSLK